MSFAVTLSTVLMMLAYSVPGYLLIKFGKIKSGHISDFATTLLYVCSPFQTVYAMHKIEYSGYMVRYLALSLALGMLLMGGMLLIVYCVLRRKQEIVAYRIYTASSALGNCGFMGIPMLEALMPEYPQGVAFASSFFLAMNILMWTAVSFIYTRDRKYISVRKIFLNPSSIAMGLSLLLFFGRIQLTGAAEEFVTTLSKMATPLCMLILGMRLAAIPLKPMFTRPGQYAASGLKLVVFPLFALAILSLLPVEREYVRTLYIICCMPVGNLILSFAEILGEGQDVAANVVLLSTILSMATVPLMTLIV
ncbi:MAG: AEC family transporter [Clostridia bacterium]|nr:AEC family transporter [Clostridia bacterium]